MKARKVIVTLEIETSQTLGELRDKESWHNAITCGFAMDDTQIVHQVQVNVIKKDK